MQQRQRGVTHRFTGGGVQVKAQKTVGQHQTVRHPVQGGLRGNQGQRGGALVHRQGGQQAGQAQHMVAMLVGDADGGQWSQGQSTAQQLVLGAFATVDQHPALALRQRVQGQCGDVAAPGGHPGGRAQKGQVHEGATLFKFKPTLC